MENKDRISLLGVIGIALTTVVGSGIWKDSLLWSNSAGIFSLVALLVGWALMFTVGLSYAECVSMFPQGGGPYSYVGGVFGKKVGSTVGIIYLMAYWCVISILSVISSLFTLAALSAPTFEMLVIPNIAVLTLVYIVTFALLARVTPGKKFGNMSFVWAILKIALLLGVTLLVLRNWSPTTSFALPTFDGFQLALNSSLWALFGFETILVFAGETFDSEYTAPRGILITLSIVLIVYLVVGASTAGVIGIGDIPADTGSIGLIMILSSFAGLSPNLVFSFAAFSAVGTGYAAMVVAIKQVEILANDDVLPKSFSECPDSNMRATILNVLVIGIISLIMSLLLEVENGLVVDVVVAVGIGFILLSAMFPAGGIALYLRFKMPALVRPFRTPAYFIVFPLAISLSLYLFVLSFWNVVFGGPAMVLFLISILAACVYVKVFNRQ